MQRRKEGFTLLEMLIVLGLVATLMFVSMPTYIYQSSKARKTTDEANLHVAYQETLAKMIETEKDEYSWVTLHAGLGGEDSTFLIFGIIADEDGPYVRIEDEGGYYLKPPADGKYIKVIVYSGQDSPDGDFGEVKYEPHSYMIEETSTNK